MSGTLIHVLSNVLLIGLIYLFDEEVQDWFKKDKKLFAYLSLSVFASNIIDIDHLLANPMYDPNRCSINFHPLHSWYTIPLWVVGLLVHNKFVRYFSLGVLLHLWLDWIDCLLI